MKSSSLRRCWFVLAGLLVFEASALIGFATLGLHPHWLDDYPAIAARRDAVFSCFAQLQLYGSMAVLATFLVYRWKWQWLPAFASVFGISLAAEYLGTISGMIFGQYQYSALLGYAIGGRVPVVVPMSWFAMGIASYLVSSYLLPQRFVLRHLTTAAFLVTWDLALDPAMSRVTAFWSWTEGIYYGIPLTNVAGWLFTGLAISLALEWTIPEALPPHEIRWVAAYYVVNFLLPLGMMLAAGLWTGSLIAVMALIGTYVAARTLGYEDGLLPLPAEAQ